MLHSLPVVACPLLFTHASQLARNPGWEFYPHVARHRHAHDWLEIQALLGLADATIAAYGRGADDYLAFCQRADIPVSEATKADIAAYVDDMARRPNAQGATIRYVHSGVGLANATMQQRLTVVRLYYDYLLEEGLRLDARNPVGRGVFTPGRAFAGKRDRGILRRYVKLPWIPGDDEWEAILAATASDSLRNRLMLLLAYDGALRRGELVALEVRDIAFPHQQITIRPEIAKNRAGRVVMYGEATRHALQRYLDARAAAGITGGLLLRSSSNRNQGAGLTPHMWDKIITRIASQAGLQHRFTTHTLRHLRLTDLARAGLDLHTIAQYAGHRSIDTTKIYITLSGRETAERVRVTMRDLDRRLQRLGEEAAADA